MIRLGQRSRWHGPSGDKPVVRQFPESEQAASDEWAAWKERSVKGFVLLAVALGLGLAFIPPESRAFTVLRYSAFLIMMGLILLWILADAMHGDYHIGRVVFILILGIPIIGIPVYVLRGRGIRRGGVMVAKMVGFVLLLAVIIGLTNVAVAYLVSGYLPGSAAAATAVSVPGYRRQVRW